jgi:hypothetical protein
VILSSASPEWQREPESPPAIAGISRASWKREQEEAFSGEIPSMNAQFPEHFRRRK